VRNNWDKLVEHKAHPLPVAKFNVMKAVLAAYYQGVDKDIIFDKSRSWLAYLEMIESLIGEKAKVVVNVRPIPDILSSLEKIYRETTKDKQPPGEAKNYIKLQTIEGRCDYWMQPDQLVGLTLNRIKDAFDRGYGDRMFILPYENLTKDPKNTMKKLYEFLEEPYYEHNYQYVEQVTFEDDEVHGFGNNLHKIRKIVKFQPSDAIQMLGKDIVEKYSKK
jgi:sulfotransferase